MHLKKDNLEEQLTALRHTFWSKRELIALTGAGISVNAGGKFVFLPAMGGILADNSSSSRFSHPLRRQADQ